MPSDRPTCAADDLRPVADLDELATALRSFTGRVKALVRCRDEATARSRAAEIARDLAGLTRQIRRTNGPLGWPEPRVAGRRTKLSDEQIEALSDDSTQDPTDKGI